MWQGTGVCCQTVHVRWLGSQPSSSSRVLGDCSLADTLPANSWETLSQTPDPGNCTIIPVCVLSYMVLEVTRKTAMDSWYHTFCMGYLNFGMIKEIKMWWLCFTREFRGLNLWRYLSVFDSLLNHDSLCYVALWNWSWYDEASHFGQVTLLVCWQQCCIYLLRWAW